MARIMSVVSHEVWDGRRLLYRGAWASALVLLAACGGEPRETAGAGTEGAAVTDTAPAPSADTATASGSDTTAQKPTHTAAADTAAAAAARDAAANQPSEQPSAPATPATPATPTRTETAAKPAEPKTPAQQPAADTSSAAADPAATAQADTGTGQTETATAPLRDAYHQAPKDTVDQTTYDGWKQYNLNCARCHGEDVLGSTIAPQLIMSLKPNGPINTQEKFVEVVCAGRPEKGMPSWCALGMDPANINQIHAYVKGRSEGKIGPGRPAVKSEG
jgi:hypothetical protein